MSPVGSADAGALIWFLVCWFGYSIYADRWHRPRSLMGTTARHRARWMERMIERDNRVLDSTLVGTLVASVSFFAQTSLVILAGLIAVLGAQERAAHVLSELPAAAPTTPEQFQLKVILLIVIFVFAFFKFTWSLRLFNYLVTLIGGAPPPTASSEALADAVRRAARMSDLAVNHFNVGIRAYYFGLAALAWFVQPWLFAVASVWVVLVLWRREFHSNTLKALRD